MVADKVQLCRYAPLALCGLALMTAFMTARAFSAICSAVKDALPIGTCTLPALSILNSTRPAFTSFTALAVSSVTVPVFGLGIRPRGPSTLPSLRTSPMASGVATATSKSDQPSWHFLIMSSKPTYSAPAAFAASAPGPLLANTSTRTVLPLPCGSGTVPRTIWSDCLGSTPSPGHDPKSRFLRTRIQVFGFELDDFQNLFARHLADLLFIRLFGTDGDAGGFFEEHGCGRRFGDESERFVLKHGNHHRNHHSGLIFCRRVKFLAKSHDVDAVLTQRRAHRGRGICLPSRDLQLNLSGNFLCHKTLTLNLYLNRNLTRHPSIRIKSTIKIKKRLLTLFHLPI